MFSITAYSRDNMPVEEQPKTGYKTCTRCGKNLPLYQFAKRNRSIDGLQLTCRCCQSLIHQERKARSQNGQKESSEKGATVEAN